MCCAILVCVTTNATASVASIYCTFLAAGRGDVGADRQLVEWAMTNRHALRFATALKYARMEGGPVVERAKRLTEEMGPVRTLPEELPDFEMESR